MIATAARPRDTRTGATYPTRSANGSSPTARLFCIQTKYLQSSPLCTSRAVSSELAKMLPTRAQIILNKIPLAWSCCCFAVRRSANFRACSIAHGGSPNLNWLGPVRSNRVRCRDQSHDGVTRSGSVVVQREMLCQSRRFPSGSKPGSWTVCAAGRPTPWANRRASPPGRWQSRSAPCPRPP